MKKSIFLIVMISISALIWPGGISGLFFYTNAAVLSYDTDLSDFQESSLNAEVTADYYQTRSGLDYIIFQPSQKQNLSAAACLLLLPAEENMETFLEETKLTEVITLEAIPVLCVRADWDDRDAGDQCLSEIWKDLKEQEILTDKSVFIAGYDDGADFAAREALLHVERYAGLVTFGGEGLSEDYMEENSADPDTDHSLSVWIIAPRKTSLFQKNINFWKEWNGIKTSDQAIYQCTFADELYMPVISTAGKIDNSNNRMGIVLFSRYSDYRGASICSNVFHCFMSCVKTDEVDFRNSLYSADMMRIDDQHFSYYRQQIEGQQRDYWIYVPDQAMSGEDEPSSLILCLHGNGGSGAEMIFRSQWQNIAAENNCIVLYPSSLYKSASQHYWLNIEEEIDFLRWLVMETCQRFNVDRTHIYVTGFSNGAGMAQNLAVRCSDIFAAAALSAPVYFDEEYYTGPIQNFNAVAILFSYGTEDPYLEEFKVSADIDGLPAFRHLEYWRDLYGFQQNYYKKEIRGKFTVYTFGSANQIPVCQWIVVEGKKHDYPEEEVGIYYDFMKQFSKGEDGKLYYNGSEVDIRSEKN